MRADWSHEARVWIADATKDLPESASLAERRRALRTVACSFHGGTSWGQKVWSKECRKYLEQHGLPKRTPDDVPPTSKLHAKLAAPDIIFPYRSAGQ